MGKTSATTRKKRVLSQRQSRREGQRHRYEIEVAAGLESVAEQELLQHLDKRAIIRLEMRAGALQFDYAGDMQPLLNLKTVTAGHLLLYYDVPRPRALLGHEHFHRLLSAIDIARNLTGRSAYRTFYVNAAGSDSSIMARLKQELAAHTGLYTDDVEGDLLVRIRRAKPGWEVLVRLSPRPLAAREWRVCNMEGALNASVAHAMLRLRPVSPTDVVLNLACGSGTLMIERLNLCPARRIIGCDINPFALDCARANIKAAGYDSLVDLVLTDARSLPLDSGAVDILCADLPFGQRVGSHEENRELYPLILLEAARVACSGAAFMVITHEIHLMEALLAQSALWRAEDVLKITLRGLHPRIFVLRKI